MESKNNAGNKAYLKRVEKKNKKNGITQESKQEPGAKRILKDTMTRAIGIDCEMVGVGHKGSQSILARVSLVNQYGDCLYDKYVAPTEPVTDYRTSVSGIRPEDIENGEDFKKVQKEVCDIISRKNCVLVGHALRNDLKVLMLDHVVPKSRMRDTSVYFRKMLKGRTPSLKRLTSTLLGASIQCGEHDSVQDAKAAMMLYAMYKSKWEKELKMRRNPQQRVKESKKRS